MSRRPKAGAQATISSFFHRAPPKEANGDGSIEAFDEPPSKRVRTGQADSDLNTAVQGQSRALAKPKKAQSKRFKAFEFNADDPVVSDATEGTPSAGPTVEPTPGKASLHDRFVNKLGREQSFEVDGTNGTSLPKAKLTPLERQYVDIKEGHPDMLLIIEVGYKFRFFGEDARVASRVLHIAHFMDHNFFTASIPVHRIHVHTKRLVEAGYKVGIVRQQESAAIKASGDNKNAPFVRTLTDVYTRGTYIHDDDEDVAEITGPRTGYIMCILEISAPDKPPQSDSLQFALLAVQPATGDIVWDYFTDTFMRSELETRLVHLQPCEIIVSEPTSAPTDKVLAYLGRHGEMTMGEKVRIERTPAPPSELLVESSIQQFYAANSTASDVDDKLSRIRQLPKPVLNCLYCAIKYLKEFGLDVVFDRVEQFHPFSGRATMLLNGSSITNLEIFTNLTDGSETGSLFWTVDHTRTRFGRRLLRSWIGTPLLDREQLEQRLAIVSEILKSSNPRISKLKSTLSRLPDLETVLCKIHYGRCPPSALLSFLQAFRNISRVFPATDNPRFESAFLNEIVRLLPTINDSAEEFLDHFHHQAAAQDDKIRMFTDELKYEAVAAQKYGILTVENELMQHLEEIRSTLKKPTVAYCMSAGIEYLIEVRNSEVSKLVPRSWSKIGGTKTVSRFHTPEVIRMLSEREQRKELLEIEANKAFASLLKLVTSQYGKFRNIVMHLASLDCYFSMASLASQPGYCKPEFVEEGIEVIGARHPMIEQGLVNSYVPNDVKLGQQRNTAVILTGPNMGGKSSYIRQVALVCVMAQIGCFVPAASAKVALLDAVFTRMGARDNIFGKESTFMVEMREASEILRAASPRSLIILDEIGRGTSTFDGQAIAYAILDHIVNHVKAMTLFVTHYGTYLQVFEKMYPNTIGNYHMGYVENGLPDGSKEIVFLYKLESGIAHKSYGLNVARMAQVPREVVLRATQKATEFEDRTSSSQKWDSVLSDILSGDDRYKHSPQDLLYLLSRL